MSQIFYSEVDAALQAELNARGRAGKSDRSTAALNYMLGKIANVELIAYEQAKKSTGQELHRLGGYTVRQGEYLPTGTKQSPGFLDDRDTTVITGGWTSNADGTLAAADPVATTTTNKTKRIPPYITSVDVSIGDHSMGLLNKATINIKIPNPQQDFDFFESVWLRPGRPIDVIIEHPDSAVITQGQLSGSLPSVETIKKLNPSIDIQKVKKMNRYQFSGLLTNFVFSYDADASVSVTINLTGTSNIYTSMNLLMNTTDENRNEVNITVGDEPPAGSPAATAAAEDTSPNQAVLSLYTNLEFEVKTYIETEDQTDSYKKTPWGDQFQASAAGLLAEFDSDRWYLTGSPPTQQNKNNTYITLGWLISYLNRVILNKLKTANPDSDPIENGIICSSADDLCTSNYYSELVSNEPDNILLLDSNNSKSSTYDSIEYYRSFNNTMTLTENNQLYPARILINLTVIRDIIDKYKTIKSKFNVNSFLKDISVTIQRCTADAINMTLISHPEIPNALLYYDCNRVRFSTNVTPYSIPMFGNSVHGTIVREFQFSAKIPDSVKTLSYVMNQNPEEISSDDIAPYMNYMYNASNVSRLNGQRDSSGRLTELQNVTQNEDGTRQNANATLLSKLNKDYSEKHKKYIGELAVAKTAFGKNPSSANIQLQLRQAMIKYIQYPHESIQRTNQLTAPMYPFDATITIDGINGFRYGDVVEFRSLPARFRTNTVFSIINITHTVSTSGEWITKLQCIMRPKFD